MEATEQTEDQHRSWRLTLMALGVVYGDIGTSPLYAIRQCFNGTPEVPLSPTNILGVLSLIFWSLIIVISLKYLTLILRADNNGEGGILALTALLLPESGEHSGRWMVFTALLGVFGAALLYGDGMITPAISVLSAVEGLEVAEPQLATYIIPLTTLILVSLFVFQSRGTAGVARVFGPIMLVWFAVLAALGLRHIVQAPVVLEAVDPWYAVDFFAVNRVEGFLILGVVFLAVTGGEALYADIGHFGKAPIRIAWFALVLPALLCNYFGQGALLLVHPERVHNPFFHMAPVWALYPMIALATVATVIASQAVITGAFSLTMQAVQLRYLPAVRILHTSAEEFGQIYVPVVNWIMLVCCIGLVLGFRTSGNLSAAYGVGVVTTMAITTVLAFQVMARVWEWHSALAGLVTMALLGVDLAFFGATYTKLPDGGWFPLVVGALALVLMSTWRRGGQIFAARLREQGMTFGRFFQQLATDPPERVPGTAVFLHSQAAGMPQALLRNVRFNHVLHERNLIVNVASERRPYLPISERVHFEQMGQEFYRVILRYGFMQQPNVPAALMMCREHGLDLKQHELVYILGRETLLPIRSQTLVGMALWREKLYSAMQRNAAGVSSYFRLPPRQIIEIGSQIEL